jgi:predicted transcriptional regulator
MVDSQKKDNKETIARKEQDRFKEAVESGLKDIAEGKTVSMEEAKRILFDKPNPSRTNRS